MSPGSAPRVRSASSAAWISMRWLVVLAAPPLAHGSPVGATAHAHPPGPGLPEQAPSVNTIRGSRSSSSAIPAEPPIGFPAGRAAVI